MNIVRIFTKGLGYLSHDSGGEKFQTEDSNVPFPPLNSGEIETTKLEDWLSLTSTCSQEE